MGDKRTEAGHKRYGVPRCSDLIDYGGVGEPHGEELEDVVRDGDGLDRLEGELDEDGELEENVVLFQVWSQVWSDIVQVCTEEYYLLVRGSV